MVICIDPEIKDLHAFYRFTSPALKQQQTTRGSRGGDILARINIEECWWSDPRRMKLLLKIGYVTDAAVVNMWRTAQSFWSKGRTLVPKHVFDTLEYSEDLIECSMADVRESFVYVRGSSEYLEWTAEKREQAREAGKKSAEARRKATGSAQPKRLKKVKNTERTSNDPRTKVNDAEPSGSYSSSGSDSDSDSGDENSSNSKPQAFVARYCERFKLRWGTNPEIQGKESGIAKRLAKEMGFARYSYLLDAYFQMPDAWLVKIKHPLAAFESKLNEVVVFADSGKFTTSREAFNADNMATNALLAQKVQRGEV